ncbi:DNA glycosylase [Peniophora sp. CONT]|nr:DNA glycosylase [Peniophora sp. CONT]
MMKEECIESQAETEEHNAKAQSNLRSLLTSYSYRTPTLATPPSLPRRSPRNLSNDSPLKPSTFYVKAETESFTLPLTPTSNVKTRVGRTGSSLLPKKRKRESEEDDCLPLPLSPPDRAQTSSLSGKAMKKQKRGYAPPETYAHLKGLPDHLAYELDIIFCGINPGYKSAESGAHYAHPANHFWRCLHQGGFTPTRLPPLDGYLLPETYNVGLTNIVERPSAEAGELSRAEIEASVQALMDKLTQYRPRVVCFVGKLIWDAVVRVLNKQVADKPPPVPKKGEGAKALGPFVYDRLQPYKLVHTTGLVNETLFFVVPSTSGRVVSHQLADKVMLFSKLKSIVEEVKTNTYDTSGFLTVNVSSPGSQQVATLLGMT